jgi:hypothetical protein
MSAWSQVVIVASKSLHSGRSCRPRTALQNDALLRAERIAGLMTSSPPRALSGVVERQYGWFRFAVESVIGFRQAMTSSRPDLFNSRARRPTGCVVASDTRSWSQTYHHGAPEPQGLQHSGLAKRRLRGKCRLGDGRHGAGARGREYGLPTHAKRLPARSLLRACGMPEVTTTQARSSTNAAPGSGRTGSGRPPTGINRRSRR